MEIATTTTTTSAVDATAITAAANAVSGSSSSSSMSAHDATFRRQMIDADHLNAVNTSYVTHLFDTPRIGSLVPPRLRARKESPQPVSSG